MWPYIVGALVLCVTHAVAYVVGRKGTAKAIANLREGVAEVKAAIPGNKAQ